MATCLVMCWSDSNNSNAVFLEEIRAYTQDCVNRLSQYLCKLCYSGVLLHINGCVILALDPGDSPLLRTYIIGDCHQYLELRILCGSV